MTWKDGGNYGRFCREIVSEDGERGICHVWTQQVATSIGGTEPWPEGKANFSLILKAPQMLEALEEIAALTPGVWCCEVEDEIICDQMQEIARTAIAAVKGRSDEID